MEVEVYGYEDHPNNFHYCKDEAGKTRRIDLLVGGSFGDMDPQELVGKTVIIYDISSYVEIAHEAEIKTPETLK